MFNKKPLTVLLYAAAAIFVMPAFSQAATCGNTAQGFDGFLKGFRKEAAAQGVDGGAHETRCVDNGAAKWPPRFVCEQRHAAFAHGGMGVGVSTPSAVVQRRNVERRCPFHRAEV